MLDIHTIGPWIDVAHLMQLLAGHHGDLAWCSVPDYCVEESVHQRVGVSLSADAGESTVEESCVLQHLPDCRITPVIGYLLWEDLDQEVVVATLE